MSRGPKAYVFGAYVPNGGTYMAYHLGRILDQHFGFPCRAVIAQDELAVPPLYEYADRFDSISVEELEREVQTNDILVVNPSFSAYLFGLKLPCKKLMYIQHFNTYSVIDGFCDYYVCVSRVVQQYVKLVCGWEPPVIPAFIHVERIMAVPPWRDRPPSRVLVYGKQFSDQLLAHLEELLRTRHPSTRVEFASITAGNHQQFLRQLPDFRYFLSLSPCEGFGLVSLEAMAAGCTVVGFHAQGGLEYMQSGKNCSVVGYPRLEQLAQNLVSLVREPERAEEMAGRGQITAQQFGYEAFEKRWVEFLLEILKP